MVEDISMVEIIVTTPGKAERMGPIDMSEEIIQKLTLLEQFYLIGIGSSIPRVISAVDISSRIARVNIESVSLDYVDIQLYGKEEAVFIKLSRMDQEPNHVVAEFEGHNNFHQQDRTVWVGRGNEVSKITSTVLFKLSEYGDVKIMASGFPILTAIESALQIVKSGISRTMVGISAVSLLSIPRRSDPGKKMPAINIYLEHDIQTEYPEYHEDLKKKILGG